MVTNSAAWIGSRTRALAGVRLLRRRSRRLAMIGVVSRAWERFWFEPQETSSLALFRIAFGLIAVAWTLTLLPNLSAFYGPTGVLPDNAAHNIEQWGLLDISNSPHLLIAVFALTLASAIAVTIGL